MFDSVGVPAQRSSLSRALELWVILSAIHLFLYVRVAGTAAHAIGLPLALRVRVGLLEPAWLFPVAFVLGVLIDWRQHLQQTKADRFMRSLAATLTFGAFVFFLLAYGGSWFTLIALGRFPDPAAFRYALASPAQMFQSASDLDPLLALGVPAVALIAALVLDSLLLRLPAPRWMAYVLGALFAADLVAVAVLAPSPDLDDIPLKVLINGLKYTMADEYALVGGERAGPLVTLVTGWLRPEADRELGLAGLSRQVQWRRIESPNEYIDATARAQAKMYNVLLVVIESLRSDQLTEYGSPVTVMPTVEEVAADGRVYTDMYSTATQSNLAAIVPVSGAYPLRGTVLDPYPEDIPYPRTLLYDLIKPLGYRTGVFSSQNESWGGMSNFIRSRGLDTLLEAQNYIGPTYVPRGDAAFTNFLRGTRHAGKIDDRYTVGEALGWIISASEPKPFFAAINLQSSHLPYDVPSDFPPKFGTGDVGFDLEFSGYPVDSVPVVLAKYRNSLAYADAQLARLIHALKDRGIWDSTIVVITGDHGEAFYEHGVAAHANGLWDEELRVPLVIHAPGLAPGKDPRPASHVDIVPTVLDLLHLPPHPGVQGVSLLREPLKSDRSRYFVVLSPLAKQYGVAKDSLKLTVDAQTGSERLVDLRSPSDKRDDISEARPEDAAWLRRQADAWRTVQLYYYGDRFAMARYFPPLLDELPATVESH